jgi:chromosome segregation ATPase
MSQRVRALETELAGIGANIQAQLNSKDELIKSLQEQVTLWRNKYEALAKLYTQLRTEHLELLSRQKQMALKANSAQESIDRMERMEREMKAKNLELADMIRERDRARFETDRLKSVSGFTRTLTVFDTLSFSPKRKTWSDYGGTFASRKSGRKTQPATRAPRCLAC